MTKKEDIQFGVLMCFCMFSVMFFYNLFLNGRLGHMTWLEGVLTYVIGFAITLLIEMCIVGPSAKKQPAVLPQKARKSILFSLFLSASCLGWCVSCLYADM